MLSVAEAGPEQQKGDPGSVDVGAVPNLHAARAAGLSEGERSEELQRPGKEAEGRVPQQVVRNLLPRAGIPPTCIEIPVLRKLKPPRINGIIWICPKSIYQMTARCLLTEARLARSCRTY